MSIIQIDEQSIFCSVVMPVHNGAKYLREAIESVLNQTYANFEFLIIENCSEDESREIIKSYNDPRIKLIIENDCGQVQAYNRGFREAKGDFIFIHDQDDISHPERFERQLTCLYTQKIDICGSYFIIIDELGNEIFKMTVATNNNDINHEILYKNWTIFNSSVCLKKNIFYKMGYFSSKYYPSADYEFYLRAMNNVMFGNIPHYLYKWRRHSKQISSYQEKEIRKKTLEISLSYVHKFPKRQKHTYTGLVYYYNNKLLAALFFFMVAFFTDKKTSLLSKYFLTTLLFGIPLKICRKFSCYYSNYFLKIKKLLYK